MKIFHLREKSSQHLLLPVWVVLGLVGRKLELAVPFSQLLQMKVHLDMFGIKKSCFFLEVRLFYGEREKKEAHLSHARLYFASRLLQIQRWTITESQNITIYHLEQCNKYLGGEPSTGSPGKIGILCQRPTALPSGRDNFPTFYADLV